MFNCTANAELSVHLRAMHKTLMNFKGIAIASVSVDASAHQGRSWTMVGASRQSSALVPITERNIRLGHQYLRNVIPGEKILCRSSSVLWFFLYFFVVISDKFSLLYLSVKTVEICRGNLAKLRQFFMFCSFEKSSRKLFRLQVFLVFFLNNFYQRIANLEITSFFIIQRKGLVRMHGV